MLGIKTVEINGEKLKLRFNWKAISGIVDKFGDSPNLFSPEILAEVAAFGLEEFHPEWTKEKVIEASPPLFPFANAVQEALSFAYFGGEVQENVAEEAEIEKKKIGFFARLKALFLQG